MSHFIRLFMLLTRDEHHNSEPAEARRGKSRCKQWLKIITEFGRPNQTTILKTLKLVLELIKEAFVSGDASVLDTTISVSIQIYARSLCMARVYTILTLCGLEKIYNTLTQLLSSNNIHRCIKQY